MPKSHLRALVLGIVIFSLAATSPVPCWSQVKKTIERKNISSVAANDFTLRVDPPNKITTAHVERPDGSQPFADTAIAGGGESECKFPKERLSGAPIAVGARVIVTVTTTAEGWVSGVFTLNNVEIDTEIVETRDKMIEFGDGHIEYECTNPSLTESVVLTDIRVHNHGDPTSIYTPGVYTGGGSLVSYTSSHTLAPGASQNFSVGFVAPNRSCSIEYDVALATTPSEKYGVLQANHPSALLDAPEPSGSLTFTVGRTYPNPALGTFFADFRLPEPARVTIRIFDVQGRERRTPVRNELFGAGAQSRPVGLDGLPPGLYIWRIEARMGSRVETAIRRVVYL